MALVSSDPKYTEMTALIRRAGFRHIAFIMDGNGRWAKKRGLPRELGHKAGSETFKKICIYCCDIGFDAVTVYAFSTENWKRPRREVDAIMALLDSFLDELKRDHALYHNRFRFIGQGGGNAQGQDHCPRCEPFCFSRLPSGTDRACKQR